MLALAKIIKYFVKLYFTLVIIAYLYGLIVVLKESSGFWGGLNKFWDIQSPFNMANTLTIVLFCLPGLVLQWVSNRIEQKYLQ